MNGPQLCSSNLFILSSVTTSLMSNYDCPFVSFSLFMPFIKNVVHVGKLPMEEHRNQLHAS